MAVSKEIEDVGREHNGVIRAGASVPVQALLGTLPWTGGIGAAVATYAQDRRSARLEAFLAQVSEQLTLLAQSHDDDLQEAWLSSDSYADRLIEVAVEACVTRDDKRRAYLADYLVACSRARRPDETWLDLFWRYLNRLSGSHILALHAIFAKQRGIPASDRLGARNRVDVPLALSTLVEPDLPQELLRVALADLSNLGLLVDWRVLNGGTSPFGHEYTLTRNGMYFIRFLDRDWPAAPGEPVRD